MGCAGSRSILLTVQQQQSRKIDQEIETDRTIKKLTLLLLGASESGKTTLFKQMRILHTKGFCLSERMQFKTVIIDNLFQYTKDILLNMPVLNIPFDDQDSEARADMFLTNIKTFQNIPDLRVKLKCLYDSRAFQACMKRGDEYCLGDGAQHLFKSFDRIASPDYVPTDQDILFSRIVTTGITELNFNFKGNNLCMVDVGGQSSERRKWIHCFDNVTSVIFTAAMSFYDQQDDNTKMNKLLESLMLFRSLCTNKFLTRSAFVLFLNKMDVFKSMIQKKSLKCCFPSYKGDNSFNESAEYICKQFEKAGSRTSGLYPHYTTATDTNSFKRVFDTTMEIILQQNLAVTGLL